MVYFGKKNKEVEVANKNIVLNENSRYSIWLLCIAVFVLLMSFQIILNKNEVVPRSLPDEIGAMALAAKINGYNWSYVLSKAAKYYGFGTVLPFWWAFKVSDDALDTYQILLGCGAFLRTVPVFFCFSVLSRIDFPKKINPIEIALISSIAVLAAPTRSTNIDNEPMLILIGWIICYLIFVLASDTSYQMLCSIVLAVVISYAQIIHTRGNIYLLALFIILFVYNVSTGKHLLRYRIFFPLLFGSSFFAKRLITIVQNSLYKSEIYQTELGNTTTRTVTRLYTVLNDGFFSVEMITDLLSTLSSNIWCIYTYYHGMIILLLTVGIVIIYKTVREKKYACWNEWLPMCFAVIVFLIEMNIYILKYVAI